MTEHEQIKQILEAHVGKDNRCLSGFVKIASIFFDFNTI